MNRTFNIEVETTIAGGLPILVEGTICPAEPDVGIFSAYADEICIYWIPGKNGKKKHVPDRLFDKADLDDLERQLMGEARADGEAYDEARGEYLLEMRREREDETQTS